MKPTVPSAFLALVLSLMLVIGLMPTGLAQENQGDFSQLSSLMDLVATASVDAMGNAESIGDENSMLSAQFINVFLSAGQAIGQDVGINADLLSNTDAQSSLLSSIFAAQLPTLAPIVQTQMPTRFVGFHPVSITSTDSNGGVQLIGELYTATKPLSGLTEGEFDSVQWLDRAVFSFRSDETGYQGFRLTGFSIGTELSMEQTFQGYYEEIVIEYISNLGFTVLYPAVFGVETLVEDATGISAQLNDGSFQFFARRTDNVNSSNLTDYVSVIANGISGATYDINAELQRGSITYTTADGYRVFDLYIVTDRYIYQAELKYLATMASTYSMYHPYLENSFDASELTAG